MHISSIVEVLHHVEMAGAIALDQQRKTTSVKREYKSNGSVFTDIDKEVEDYLFEKVSQRFPDVNILTEETRRFFDPARPYTFAIDPIDGTDVFSQGMAGWCVSVGLLDRSLSPIAGIVFSPTLDLLVFADIGKRASCSGGEIALPDAMDVISPKTNIMVSSRIHRQANLAGYPGKIRSIGSAALHFCFPLIYPAVAGAIQHSGVRIWDIAGAHAINLSCGLRLQYLGGGKIDYSDIVDGSPTADAILCGPDETVEALRAILNWTLS